MTTTITWQPSPEDPDVLEALTGTPINADISTTTHTGPSDDYDTPHTTTRYHWTVSNDTTGATIAHGTTTSLREAKDTCHTHLTPYLP